MQLESCTMLASLPLSTKRGGLPSTSKRMARVSAKPPSTAKTREGSSVGLPGQLSRGSSMMSIPVVPPPLSDTPPTA